MNKNNQLFLGSLLALSLTSLSAHAANINTVFSWETADYDTPANYSGYRLDININPTKSNWYFDAGLRQREADNNSRYQRLDLQAGYRYKINNGWIQPSFKVRQDITSYDNGNRILPLMIMATASPSISIAPRPLITTTSRITGRWPVAACSASKRKKI
ncbi:hypothetical protein NMD64_02700 [Edwardsiella tarda]|uniref:hypothetical protein n=1 Tax=Edwardsiella tarda TaxID=636 RepID=UPI00351BED6A